MDDDSSGESGARPSFSLQHHAAERWARLVWAARFTTHDPRTLSIWADIVGMSVPTLRTRCYMAGVSPRRSLTLARLLRAVTHAAADGADLADLLDVREPRTVRRLLARCGLLPAHGERAPLTIAAFLDRQHLVRVRFPLESLHRLAATCDESDYRGRSNDRR